MLHDEGISKRKISRQTGLSRSTIGKNHFDMLELSFFLVNSINLGKNLKIDPLLGLKPIENVPTIYHNRVTIILLEAKGVCGNKKVHNSAIVQTIASRVFPRYILDNNLECTVERLLSMSDVNRQNKMSFGGADVFLHHNPIKHLIVYDNLTGLDHLKNI